MLRESYTAADAFPTKLAQDYTTIRRIKREGFIRPVHLQFCPTNKCTRNCNFCSCANRDKSASLDIDIIKEIIKSFHFLGCKAVTITGGGEPLCYENLKEVIEEFRKYNIEIGLVTNADLIHKLSDDIWSLLTWCRISCSDQYKFVDKWVKPIERLTTTVQNVAWAFSYVLTASPDIDNLTKHVRFAEKVNMTHVRVVSDILNYDNIPEIDDIDSKLIIRQKRNHPTKGNRDCWISLLKPVIDPTGKIFPCCGVQYAEEKDSKDFVDSMCMGTYKMVSDIWFGLRKFDGSKCVECYYAEYNNFLTKLMFNLEHRKFV